MIEEATIEEDYPKYVRTPFPGGESFQDFAARIKHFLDDMKRENGTQIIVTPAWRFSPAILGHLCLHMPLADAMKRNTELLANENPFSYAS